MKETILLFHIDEPSLKQALQKALLPFRIRLKRVPESDYVLTLGELAGLPPLAAAEPAPSGDETSSATEADSIPAPMMIFAGIPDGKLNLILKRLRDSRIRLPYKAVLTPTKQGWTPVQCFREIRREHEAMSGSRNL